MTRLNYSNQDHSFSDFSGKNLAKANLTGAKLIGADLTDANLTSANLKYADLTDANLICADLTSANLIGAHLIGANIRYATGNGREIVNLDYKGVYVVVFCLPAGQIAIGCKQHSYEEWCEFSDDEISEMSSYASIFWNRYKDLILSSYNNKLATYTAQQQLQ